MRSQFNERIHYNMAQLSFFLCFTACLVASSMALTSNEAFRIIGESKGRTIGGTQAQLAILTKAAMAIGTPEQKACVQSKTSGLFAGSKMNILLAIRGISQTTSENLQILQTQDAASFRRLITEQCAKIQSDIVNDAKNQLQTCMA